MKTQLDILLDQLQEECAEVIQMVSKIKRFGFDEVYDSLDKNPDKLTNQQRLIGELNDQYAILDMIEDLTGLDWQPRVGLMKAKRAKVIKYMIYSRSKGLVE